ncbi:MAG: hypothetical protein AB7F32_03605 [Victivallaceae bacterium]
MIFRSFAAIVLAFSFALATSFSASAADKLVITGKVRDNPTISFAGIAGNASLSQSVEGFLKACGWFEVVKSDGQYELSGTVNGSSAAIRLSMGGVPMTSWNFTVGNPRESAKDIVDAILDKLFKVKNICKTRIAFCADTAPGMKNIFICDIDGNDVKQVTNYQSLCVEPSWFPDGNSIGYTKYGKALTEVVETRLAPTVQSRRLSSLPGLNAGVSISPDGRQMALILSPDHQVDLYVQNVGSTNPRRLTRGKAVEASPCWSPDSRKICFVSDESGRPRLYSINSDGSGRALLPSVGSESVTPDWSDDNQIVYATKVGGAYTVAVLDLKTSENIRATNVPGTWESPAWGPDNRQVVCKRSDGPRSSLFVIDTWTGKVRQLLATRNNLSMPSWSKAKQ